MYPEFRSLTEPFSECSRIWEVPLNSGEGDSCFNRPLCHECLVPDSAKVLRRPLTPRFYISIQLGILRVNEDFKIKTANFIFPFTKTTKEYFSPPHGGISPALRCSSLGSWLLWHLLLLVRLGGGEGAACHQVAVALAPAN